VYFPRRVIPMLPEKLSNGICSLNPDVDRLCMVCDMVVTYAGNMKEYKFYPAVMRSHARLTYTQVWNWIEKGGDYPHKAQIEPLYKLFQILQKKRQQRGAMEFESTETQMLFDDGGKIERIVPVVRNDAHKLIEECMLAANVCAAEFLLKNKHTALFRNHLGPRPKNSPPCASSSACSACIWAAATTLRRKITPRWQKKSPAAPTKSCCK
jgi:ribonuclease R